MARDATSTEKVRRRTTTFFFAGNNDDSPGELSPPITYEEFLDYCRNMPDVVFEVLTSTARKHAESNYLLTQTIEKLEKELKTA